MYYCTQLLQMNYTFGYKTHINETHTTTDSALYIYRIRFLYRYTVLLYTASVDELYFCEHNCTQLYTTELD